MADDLQNILTVACEAARRAGDLLMENWGNLRPCGVTEKSRNDFVTTVDRASEKLIVELLQNRFPDHGIMAEESGLSGTNGSNQWIIDPLDGTTNFVHHLPMFAVSIAYRDARGLAAAAVYAPPQQEMFSALRGGGAFLNGEPISVSAQEDFSRALLVTGFPHHSKFDLPQYLTAFAEIFYHCAGVRRPGAAAVDLCYVACGRFEAYWELGLQPWDLAAGSLIVQEAGGVVSNFCGQAGFLESGDIIAGNAAAHHRLKKILSANFEVNKNEPIPSH